MLWTKSIPPVRHESSSLSIGFTPSKEQYRTAFDIIDWDRAEPKDRLTKREKGGSNERSVGYPIFKQNMANWAD
jgi:hypothetical protein